MADAKIVTKKPSPSSEDETAKTFAGAPVPKEEPVPETSQAAVADPAVTEDVKPPKGAYIEDLTQPEAERTTDQGPVRQSHSFNDEYAGQGGRYMVNPETGAREPVYEKYIDADGATKYRKAV